MYRPPAVPATVPLDWKGSTHREEKTATLKYERNEGQHPSPTLLLLLNHVRHQSYYLALSTATFSFSFSVIGESGRASRWMPPSQIEGVAAAPGWQGCSSACVRARP